MSGCFFQPWLVPSPHPTIAAPDVKKFILTPFSDPNFRYSSLAFSMYMAFGKNRLGC